MSTLEIVDAGPAAESDAASLIFQTDPGVWNYLFRGNRRAFDRFAAGLWARPGNSFSHSEAVTVVEDGRLLALEIGYRGDREPMLRAAMREAVMGFLPRADLEPLLEQAEDIDYLTPYIPDDGYYVHFLSVIPQRQGRGLGRRLLANVLRRAEHLKCSAVHLDVYSANPAVALYAANGFRIAVETRFPRKTGMPPHYRMIRELK